MIFTVLAGRCTANAAQDVERPLRAGNPPPVGKSCHGLWDVIPRNYSHSRSIAA